MYNMNMKDFNKKIAEYLKLYRSLRGITQTELSALTGIAQPTIARVENGYSKISSNVLRQLLEHTDLKLELNIEKRGDTEIIDVFDVCNYILYKSKELLEDAYDVTNLKLNKLLYFIEVEFLTRLKKPLFNNNFRAWLHGPVYPEVYHRFKYNGSDIITPDNNYEGSLNREQKKIIDTVLKDKGYVYRSAFELRNESHREGPWAEVRKKGEDAKIEDQDIIDYYS